MHSYLHNMVVCVHPSEQDSNHGTAEPFTTTLQCCLNTLPGSLSLPRLLFLALSDKLEARSSLPCIPTWTCTKDLFQPWKSQKSVSAALGCFYGLQNWIPGLHWNFHYLSKTCLKITGSNRIANTWNLDQKILWRKSFSGNSIMHLTYDQHALPLFCSCNIWFEWKTNAGPSSSPGTKSRDGQLYSDFLQLVK